MGQEVAMFLQTTACFPVTYAERRRAPRRPARETVCRFVSEGTDLPPRGLVWNISRTGLSMLVPARPAVGSQVEAELVSPAAPWPLRVGLRLVHCTALHTGDYVLGAQFDRELAEEELRPFVGR
jgi:hypothetical protein